MGSPDIALGFSISKITTQQLHISGKKRKFKRFRWLAPQKTENGTFLEKCSKKSINID